MATATILVVDDTAQNRALAQATLEDEGYRVVLAAGGEAGVAAFEREQPDCVLLDVRMPDLDRRATCERIRALPGGRDAPIQLEVAPLASELPLVVADRTRLCQTLMNFGSNAIKYGKASGRATFEATRHAEHVRFSVVDDGIGIPADQHDKLFEPFQRAGQETGPIEGTGIGLAISKRLAGLMQGRIGFASEVGRGSQVWVEIPIYRAAATRQAAPARAISQTSPLATMTSRHKIVYVEDNPSNIAFMRELVNDLAGVELLTAPTAEIGLPLLRAHQPAVVIMDINLPGMSGLEATQQLQAWPETRHIPIVGLSAAALIKDTARAKDAGFYRYLTKPVQVAELSATLEELLVDKPR